MKSYLVKIAGREEGPYSEDQLAQMFADGGVNRATPCKPDTSGEWRSIDDYLPTLKYGTQLPPPAPTASTRISSPPRSAPVVPRQPADSRIALIDIDIPFGSILKMMFKWAIAAVIVGTCVMPFLLFLYVVIAILFAGLLGGALSGLPHR